MAAKVPWKRIIRFIALETGDVHLGEPTDPDMDVGKAATEQKMITANEIIGDSILDTSATVGDRVLIVKELLCPLRAKVDNFGIYCYGVNYKAHAAEANIEVGPRPTSFIKPLNALNGPWPAPIKVPKAGQDKGLDYEAELAVIIGKTARDVPPDSALDYVLGYTAANDVSTRFNQVQNNHWCFGKGFDSFCPIGPAVVSQAAIKDPSIFEIRGYRNDVLKQRSALDDLIFDIKYLVSRTSEGVTLEPGTVILTGTPAGVCTSEPDGPAKWMQDREEYSVFVSHGVGTLKNRYEFE